MSLIKDLTEYVNSLEPGSFNNSNGSDVCDTIKEELMGMLQKSKGSANFNINKRMAGSLYKAAKEKK